MVSMISMVRMFPEKSTCTFFRSLVMQPLGIQRFSIINAFIAVVSIC